MSEPKMNEWILIIVLAQVSSIALKLTEVGEAARWSWISVFSPTWLPVVFAAVIFSFYLFIRSVFPEKKKHVTYTSNRWQERLTEIHSAR